jgi:hypothetical protein
MVNRKGTTMTDFDPTKGDSLDDILGERTESPKAPVNLPASYQPQSFDEPCKKCGGSGYFRGWSGRTVGKCFTCKGQGKKSFATSPEKRAANREGAARREAQKATDNIDAFKQECLDKPVVAYVLESTDSFAVSLRDAVAKFGSLTVGQMQAVGRILEKRLAAQAAKLQREVAAPVIEMGRIEEMFAKAKANGLRKPKARFVGLTFSEASAASANAGALYVKEGSLYLGKITGGKFLRSRDCTAEIEAKVLEIAADPRAAAVAYGKQTGTCCCCGRELSDPASVEAGIGPICATNWGL